MDCIVKLKNNKYVYNVDKKREISQEDKIRIKKLAIPPIWKNIWISSDPTSYLQVTGKDKKNNTQYIYHPLWVEISQYEKSQRVKIFSQKINSFIKNVIYSKPITKIKIMFIILYKTYIRVGNECYMKDYNTYGLTTLKGKHLFLNKTTKIIQFKFRGKKGIEQIVQFKDNLVWKYLKSIQIKNQEQIFKGITSQELNYFIKKYMGNNFTCKDFRTWGANMLFIKYAFDKNLKLKEIIIKISKKLGHTPQICKKSYILQNIIELYNKNKLQKKNILLHNII